MAMRDCIFCKIVAGDAPGHIIDQDENIIVFVSKGNHPLICPKKHLRDIFELDDEIASKIMQKSLVISRALKNALDCDGVYVTQTNGASAGQDVFHYHMHLYPKWEDGRVLGRTEDDRAELAEGVRGNIET